ncbi:SigE family RNA polymerase sigma factor [Streptomyces sp. J2-1]|uniref:RNA polymerase sigma factor n=1 Tax=Streptomyces corallincola TaxID=2851888 RepID=UPI001C38EA37|nr:SigE family RNA polymerase sigma factor [Streptomyces corallincola]MBV2356689.1 SigE family RNA polymerase sigma factor [Streptomyces corallincola]
MTTATPPAVALPWERPTRTRSLGARLLARLRAAAGAAAEPDRQSRTTPGSDTRQPERPLGIEELYHHRRLPLVRLAVLLVDDVQTAEDVVQDAFTALFRRHGHRLESLDEPEAYLRTSVVNSARSVLRRRRTARAYVPEREQHAPAPEEYAVLHEDHREVLQALRGLTGRQREVLVLRYWSHLTEAEIAATLGLSRGAVKSTASRALSALGRRLEGLR